MKVQNNFNRVGAPTGRHVIHSDMQGLRPQCSPPVVQRSWKYTGLWFWAVSTPIYPYEFIILHPLTFSFPVKES